MSEAPLGAHCSTAGGGTTTAPPRAKLIKATALQLFTKAASRWQERECDAAEITEFKAQLALTDVRVTMAHDSYLINLASPDKTLRRRAPRASLRNCGGANNSASPIS